METSEHTEVGNKINYLSSIDNPYLKVIDGVLNVAIMADDNGIPKPLGHFDSQGQACDLVMTSGEICAMSGDYYTKAGWADELDLAHLCKKKSDDGDDNDAEEQSSQEQSSQEQSDDEDEEDNHINRGWRLINHPVQEREVDAFSEAFNNLACPDVTREQIDRIYDIDQKTYIPFIKKLNRLARQLVFYLRVKDYGKKVDKNEAHFTPWAIRAYIIGHTQALRQAQIAHDLMQLLFNQDSFGITKVAASDLLQLLDDGNYNKKKHNEQQIATIRTTLTKLIDGDYDQSKINPANVDCIVRMLNSIVRDELINSENSQSSAKQVLQILAYIIEGNYEALGVDKDMDFNDLVQELIYRYHSLAVQMELYVMHYYSDAFAAGHMSRMSFLRKELPNHFGSIIGGLAVNTMHDEDNSTGLVHVDRHWDPRDNPNPPKRFASDSESSDPATGDGNVDDCVNRINKKHCIEGMTASMADIEKVLTYANWIDQHDYAGLPHAPDVDLKRRQPQPMFMLWDDKIYYRDPITKINILGPKDYQTLLKEDPTLHGYTLLDKNKKKKALYLSLKKRLCKIFHGNKVVALTPEQEAEILAQEMELDPDYDPTKETSPCAEDQFDYVREWPEVTDTTAATLVASGAFRQAQVLVEIDETVAMEKTYSGMQLN